MAGTSAKPVPESAEQTHFFPVSIDSIDAAVLEMDLFVRFGNREAPVLYRSSGVAFAEDDRQRLYDMGHEFLYVPMRQHRAYRQQLGARLDRLFHDRSKQQSERTRIVRAACGKMIEEALLVPGQAHTIDTIGEISQHFSRWCSEDPGVFSHLVDLSAHDYYTATHMVNVGVGCGLLCQALRPDDMAYRARLIQGGLLHDLGKRGIPEEVLNKEGRLAPEEWALLQEHPERGWRELQEHSGLPSEVLDMAYGHHERLDGAGYPRKLVDPQISLATRVCTVVDVFDAISATRPYRGPTPPAKTFELMQSGVGTQFDPRVFEAYRQLILDIIDTDPDRAVPADTATSLTSLEAARPTEPDRGLDRKFVDQSEQRRFRRVNCKTTIRIKFMRLSKPLPVPHGEWTEVVLVDVSQGGLQIEIPWSLCREDVLVVALPQKGGNVIYRRARVARIREQSRTCWRAGLQFLGDDAETN